KHKDQILAIGEIGLDYYYENSASKKDELVFFEKQIQIALEYNLPAIIHLRDKDDQYNAYIDCYNIVKKYTKLNFMLHSFAGSLDIAKMFLNLNSY
ncbi:TatD family hydrolase, partial [Mycoplasmopsis synoviae]|uniref:TatD family hydrolase n=1 Tax=Mycoplasmopsis synoviae TaxID=2109 RepID=UPI00387B853C